MVFLKLFIVNSRLCIVFNMPRPYTAQEYANMHLIYGECLYNANAAVQLECIVRDTQTLSVIRIIVFLLMCISHFLRVDSLTKGLVKEDPSWKTGTSHASR